MRVLRHIISQAGQRRCQTHEGVEGCYQLGQVGYLRQQVRLREVPIENSAENGEGKNTREKKGDTKIAENSRKCGKSK